MLDEKYSPNYQLLEEAAKSDILGEGGFSGWYSNYLARQTGVTAVTDNKDTDKKTDSDVDSEEEESEIITLTDGRVDTVDTVGSTSQDVDLIMTEQTAPAQPGDGSDLDSVEESVDSVSADETNLHAIFRSVGGEGGFKRQVVVTHVLSR